MKKYVIQDREAGNVIEECSSLKEAQKILRGYEREDKKDGTFEEDFYEIVEIDEDETKIIPEKPEL